MFRNEAPWTGLATLTGTSDVRVGVDETAGVIVGWPTPDSVSCSSLNGLLAERWSTLTSETGRSLLETGSVILGGLFGSSSLVSAGCALIVSGDSVEAVVTFEAQSGVVIAGLSISHENRCSKKGFRGASVLAVLVDICG